MCVTVYIYYQQMLAVKNVTYKSNLFKYKRLKDTAALYHVTNPAAAHLYLFTGHFLICEFSCFRLRGN